MRQIGLGLQTYAQTTQANYCSGSWDWQRDGAVTEVGWVADQVNNGNPVGQLMCPSNPGQVSEVYFQLQTMDGTAFPAGSCVNGAGSAPTKAPDGTLIFNPCRIILGGGDRDSTIKERIYDKFYNTNYCATWFLCRGGANLDGNGNLKQNRPCVESVPTLEAKILSRNYTKGPLRTSFMSAVSVSAVPLMGDASLTTQTLQTSVGPNTSGAPLTHSLTGGPRLLAGPDVGKVPGPFGGGGPAVWWGAWAGKTRQDYTGFAPVHRGNCNILFADGHVGSYQDLNGDGFLNNGFDAPGIFEDANEEISPDEVDSYYSLSDKKVRQI